MNNIIYNKRTGKYLGYIDFGGNIYWLYRDHQKKSTFVLVIS